MILSNHTFSALSLDNYQNIKKFIKKHYIVSQKLAANYVTDTFEVETEKGKITFTLYKTNKLMVQSSPNNKDFINIVKEISGILSANLKKQNNLVSPLEENKLEFTYYVGCDEAGRGETFGSLYLGCALIKKENLESIENIINNKNIRKLTKKNIEIINTNLKNNYDFLSKGYSAEEIDKHSLNILLDKGYKQLLSKIIDNKKNLIIAIDDYGIGSELKDYIKTIEKEDVKVIVKHRADEEYTACKIASLGARALRVNEIEEIDNKFVLIERSTGEKIYPSSGSSSNSNTEKYLKLFRKQNPTLDFPLFVRRKWNNVKLIDKKYPKE
jgi:ribonuclease HII